MKFFCVVLFSSQAEEGGGERVEAKKSQGQETCSCTSCLPRPCFRHRRRNRGPIHPLLTPPSSPALVPRQFLTFSLFSVSFSQLARTSPITRPAGQHVGVKHSDGTEMVTLPLLKAKKKNADKLKTTNQRKDGGEMLKGTLLLLQFSY